MTAWYEIENVDDIPSPTLLIYPDRIEQNLQMMVKNCGDVSKLRPHVKTHKLPQIVEMKLRLGINKFKTSTIAECEMTANAGGKDILLSYQTVGPNIHRLIKLIKEFPETKFSALVDNFVTLQSIAKAATASNVVVNLMIDLNVGMNRTGISPDSNAFDLYKSMVSTVGVNAAGIHAYDGHIYDASFERLNERTQETFAPVWALRDRLTNAGIAVPNVIAGGTPTSRLLADVDGVEVGAGTTVLWDFGQAEISPDLEFINAAVLLGRVISHPASDRICIDLGHKSVASEMPAPRVRWFGLEDAIAVMHSEEHLVLQTDKHDLFPVGSVVYGLPRHICPTVALYNEVWCVVNGRASERWSVTARSRCITI